MCFLVLSIIPVFCVFSSSCLKNHFAIKFQLPCNPSSCKNSFVVVLESAIHVFGISFVVMIIYILCFICSCLSSWERLLGFSYVSLVILNSMFLMNVLGFYLFHLQTSILLTLCAVDIVNSRCKDRKTIF